MSILSFLTVMKAAAIPPSSDNDDNVEATSFCSPRWASVGTSIILQIIKARQVVNNPLAFMKRELLK